MTLAAAAQTIASYYDSVSGKVQTGVLMPIGQNGHFDSYFSLMLPYNNLMKSGRYTGNQTAVPGTFDVNGYIDASTSGSSQFITHSNWMQAGVYVLRWVGTGDVTWSYGTETLSGDHRREYTVTQQEADDVSTSVAPLIRIADGAPTAIELISPNEEANFDAGNLLTTLFKDAVAGASMFRTVQMQGINDDNFQTDTSFIKPFDYISWEKWQLGPEAIGKMAEELQQELWVHVPHQVTDGFITAFCAELNTYLTTQKANLELSNEVWNTGSGFAPQTRWFEQGTVAPQNATVTTATASAHAVAHGMITGASMRCFADGGGADFPYADGAARWAIVDGVDDFRFAASEADANNNIDTAPMDAAYTTVRFKPEGPSTMATSYATRCVEMWDLAEAELGSKLIKIAANYIAFAGGQQFNDMLAVPGFREGLQFMSVAPYFDFRSMPNWETQSNADLADWIMDEDIGWASETGPWLQTWADSLGSYRFKLYESGDHNAPGGSPAGDTKIVEWARSPSCKVVYDWYYPWLASKGVVAANHYVSHSQYTGNGTFGAMEFPGDTSAVKWLALKQYFDSGGAKKL